MPSTANILCHLLVLQVAFALYQQGAPPVTNELPKQNFLRVEGDDHKPKVQTGTDGKDSGKSWFPWEETKHHPSTRLQCGITEQVGAHTDKYEDCPANCPYFAQNRKDADHCTFLCVPGPECGRWNPLKPIPDSIKNTKTCRGPKVAFCTTPKLDGTDQCDVCMSGYALHHDDGQCYFQNWTIIITVSLIFAAIATVVVLWVVDMCTRTSINDESVTAAEAWRSRSKIIDRRNRGVYGTWETNLTNTKQDIAGPGMLLHFRFQLFFIVWPLCCALVWVALACFHNELFILGTRKFGTPRHNCILVAWGYETQQRLMWTKVLFLAIVYVGSFISFTWFFVNQLRVYQQLDMLELTMKDYAIELKGLPFIPGKFKTVETDIKDAVAKTMGEGGDKLLIGVSVCWDYQGDLQEDVERACAKDLNWREIEYNMEKENKKRPTPADVDKKVDEENKKITDESHIEEFGAMRKFMYKKEKAILGPDEEEGLSRPDYDKKVKDMVEGLTSSDTAFVVFTTSEARDNFLTNHESVEFDATKYKIEGVDKVTLTPANVTNEPANINWHNFGESNPFLGFLKGFFKVYVPALLVWFFGFYVPYAWSLYNFNYDNGAELPGYFSLIFTVIVCGGNATMYVVCDICCDIIGFRYKDTKQVTYMLMYLCACMINVFLDMIVTYYTAYKVMVGLDFRTYHGDRLADIDVFTEQFETYAMQRSLGENTYRYAWPSTFFLCFVLEPIVTIYVPYQVGKLIIRTHKEIRGVTAEAYLMAFEFDLGRYADILLNVFLGILIFYFPGGYIWSLFFFMSFSHCFIYCFDHWRVINVIPLVKIVSREVDWWAQVMMCGCCGVILSCLLFKANCETYAPYCMQEFGLVSMTSIAGTLHFIVHFLILLYVVPKFSIDSVDEGKERTDYKATAAEEPRTWFSVNPVHCLRSKYIHNDNYEKVKYCRYAYWGKEHLLEVNESIGCHYFGQPADAPSFDVRKSISATFSKQKKLEDVQ